MKIHRCVLILSLAFAAAAMAGGPKANAGKPAIDANAAFSRLKGLAGEWEVDSPQGKTHSRFEVIANGTVVLEHFIEPGAQEEMLTAYHLDGNKLVLTHYCMAGNQPHMVAEKFDAASGELTFAFADGSNIAPGAGHMHDASYRLTSNDQFDSKWEFVEGGKVKFSEEAHYTRVK